MFCVNCGKELPDNTKFCDRCGNAVTVTDDSFRLSAMQGAGVSMRSSAPSQPAPKVPVRRKNKVSLFAKLMIGILVAAIVIAVPILAVQLIGDVSGAPLGETAAIAEIASDEVWNYCTISQYDGVYTTRSASTDDESECWEVWTEISRLEVNATRKDFSEEVYDAPNMYLVMLAGESVVRITVTQDGKLVLEVDDEIQCYTGASAVYKKLQTRLPYGDGTSLSACIPEKGIASMGIYLRDPEGNSLADCYTTDPEVIGSIVQTLLQQRVVYGGGTYYGYQGNTIQFALTMEDGSGYYMYIQADGNGDIPMRKWTYGIYDAQDLYEILREQIRNLKQ